MTARLWDNRGRATNMTAGSVIGARTVAGGPLVALEQTATAPNTAPADAAVLVDDYPFGPDYYWRRALGASGAVADDSAQMVADVVAQVQASMGHTCAFNVWSYGLNFYEVDADTPVVDVLWDDTFPWHGADSDLTGKGYDPSGLSAYDRYRQPYTKASDGRSRGSSWPYDPARPKGPGNGYGVTRHASNALAGLRIPAGWRSSSGSDSQISFYDPVGDSYASLWQAHHHDDGTVTCVWVARQHDVSTSAGQYDFGSVSASGCNTDGGALWIGDMINGRADHGFTFAMMNAATGHVWPARQDDGHGGSPVQEGRSFYLAMTPGEVAALKLHPIAAVIADALARGYPLTLVDKTTVSIGIGAQAAVGPEWAGKPNPWNGFLSGTPTYKVMARFPWDRLVCLPAGYGKP